MLIVSCPEPLRSNWMPAYEYCPVEGRVVGRRGVGLGRYLHLELGVAAVDVVVEVHRVGAALLRSHGAGELDMALASAFERDRRGNLAGADIARGPIPVQSTGRVGLGITAEAPAIAGCSHPAHFATRNRLSSLGDAHLELLGLVVASSTRDRCARVDGSGPGVIGARADRFDDASCRTWHGRR